VIRAGETGRLVPAGDVEALAAAIKETLTDIEKTQAMKIRGREMVEAQYSLDGMLDKLEQLYMRLLGRNGGLQ
jgi:mannosyltransferase